MRAWLPLGVMVLLACPRQDAASTGPRTSAVKCHLEAPPGWQVSPSPMPDHLLEAFEDGARTTPGALSVQESTEPTLEAAVAAEKARTTASSGARPGFTLVSERPLEGGTLLTWEWRPSADAPLRRHHAALLPQARRIIAARAEEDARAPVDPLVGALATLRCTAQ